MTHTTAIIDADLVLHRSAQSVQSEYQFPSGPAISADFPKARERATDFILEYQRAVEADRVVLALSDPTGNYWRKQVLPSYKANRGSPKPVLFWNLREWMETEHECVWKPGLEGDDVCGILLTNPNKYPGTRVCVSVDKDMMTVPGLHYRPHRRQDGIFEVTREQADRNHLMQTLTGDATDGFFGIKGVGPKKAEKILDAPPRPHTTHHSACDCTPWAKVDRAYAKAGILPEDALVQARVAFILRHGWYHKDIGVKLWAPYEQENQ